MGVWYNLASGAVRAIYDARISTPAVLDSREYFPAAQRFVDAWPELRAEALLLAERLQTVPRFHELMSEQADISANDGRDWRMYLLKVYGVPVQSHLAACPRLAELVASEPDVLSATLSFLAPGKHIPRHRGPFRGILRFQLGLSMPVAGDGRPAAVLALDDREHRIGDGECLLWDDTYPHEVWNRSEQTRIALLLDVRRRGMSRDLAVLSRALIAVAGVMARRRGVV
jgi:aspartate beta-hydroxylase